MGIAKRKLAIGLAVVVALVVAVWIVKCLASWGACSWYGYQTDRPTRYAAFIGCMVQIDGKWFPRNELRVVQ